MKLSLSIAATFTAEPIQDGLDFIAHKLTQQIQVSFAPYGQVFQQLLEPGSEFISRQSGWNIILLRVDDLFNQADVKEHCGSEELKIIQLSKEFSDAVLSYSKVGVAPLLVVVTPSKKAGYGKLSEKFSHLLVETICHAPSITIISAKNILDLYPVESVFNDEGDRFGHVPYTDAFFAALASYLLRIITGLTRVERKVLVLDCDNTLWKGVCGEDGHLGVTISGGYKYLQSFLLQQFEKGMILCLSSKNSESDVQAVFMHNTQMLLPWDKLTAWKINWLPKSENIISLARELGVGLDSFIFLDDNPVEIAEVTASCPQVLAIQIPKNEQHIADLLKHVWAFDKYRVTADDKIRAKSYQDNIKRQQLQTNTISFSDFLEKLDLQVDIEEMSPVQLPRVAQLSQRTNQFNATSRRHDETALRNLLSETATSCHTVHVKDRFGDYGLVGVMLTSTDDSLITVTDLMLSCRALGKGVEYKMLSYVGSLACRKKCSQVAINFIPSNRNDPVQQFLNSMDGREDADSDADKYQFSSSALVDLKMEVVRPAADESKHEIKKSSNSVLSVIKGDKESSNSVVASDLQVLNIGIFCSKPLDVIDAVSKKTKNRPMLQQAFAQPKDGMEVSLARIWQRVLRMDKVGRNDRFIDLGGNSILLVKAHSIILDELCLDVPITTLFKFSTVRTLACHLLQSDGEKDKGMVAAKERALKSRAANRTKLKKRPLRING